MELWSGVLSWWKCHWPDLKSAGLLQISSWTPFKPQHNNPKPKCNLLVTTLVYWHPYSLLTDSLPSLNLLCHAKTDAPKAVWSIPHVSVAFFPSLKQNFMAYCSSKVSDCIFEIHQLWQSGFSWVYSNSGCSFEREIIKTGQSSHKMYSNNILNFEESTTSLNAYTKKSGNLSYVPRIWTLGAWFWVIVFLYSQQHNSSG